MTPATLLQRFRGIWRAFQKDQDSRYPELPPGPLLKRVGLDFSRVNDSELKHAQWFWNRRPRSKLLESDLYFGIYLCSGPIAVFGSFDWRSSGSCLDCMRLPQTSSRHCFARELAK
jgi:hypothetical protein